MNRKILKIEVQAQKRSFILNSPCLHSGLQPLLQSSVCFQSGEGLEKKHHELCNRFFDLVQPDRKNTFRPKAKERSHIAVINCGQVIPIWPIIPRSAKPNVWQVTLKKGFSFPIPLT